MLSARRETDQHQRVAHHLALQISSRYTSFAPRTGRVERRGSENRTPLYWLATTVHHGSQVIYTLTDYSSMVQVVWFEHTVSASQMRRDTNFAIPGYEGKNPHS